MEGSIPRMGKKQNRIQAPKNEIAPENEFPMYQGCLAVDFSSLYLILRNKPRIRPRNPPYTKTVYVYP